MTPLVAPGFTYVVDSTRLSGFPGFQSLIFGRCHISVASINRYQEKDPKSFSNFLFKLQIIVL